MKLQKIAIILVLSLIGIFFFITITNYSKNTSNNTNRQEVKTATQESKYKDDLCISRVSLGELKYKNNHAYIVLCKDWIGLTIISPNNDSLKPNKFEDVNSFKDLFVPTFVNSNIYLERVIDVFPTNSPKFFSIKSIYHSGGSYLEAFGIYKFGEDKLIENVFKRKFGDIKGRSVSVTFSNSSNQFEIKSESHNLETQEWIKTIEQYSWNEDKNTFLLTNKQITKEK